MYRKIYIFKDCRKYFHDLYSEVKFYKTYFLCLGTWFTIILWIWLDEYKYYLWYFWKMLSFYSISLFVYCCSICKTIWYNNSVLSRNIVGFIFLLSKLSWSEQQIYIFNVKSESNLFPEMLIPNLFNINNDFFSYFRETRNLTAHLWKCF